MVSLIEADLDDTKMAQVNSGEDRDTFKEMLADLPPVGWLLLREILRDKKAEPPVRGFVPCGRTAWYEGIKRGWYPPPHKFGRGVAYWSVADIRRLVETGDWRKSEDRSAATITDSEAT